MVAQAAVLFFAGMKGVILAAGKGTRLYPVTRHIAKPLLPIANRPTLEYAFDRMRELDVHDVCIVVGENERQMQGALGSGSQFGLRLSYSRQNEPKGLAHAVGFAEEFVGRDAFVLYLGDAFYSKGFEEQAERFRTTEAANLNIVRWVEDPRRFGVASLEGEQIVRLREKPTHPESNYAMAGMYFFGPQIWDVLPRLQPSARGEFEITDAIQMLIEDGEKVLGGVYDGDWFDTGTLPSFLETSRYLTDGGALVDPSAFVSGDVGQDVVVGAGAKLECGEIRDSVILPGASVHVEGGITGSLLGGEVRSKGDLHDSIRFGAEAK